MVRRYSNPYETTVGEKIAAAIATGLMVLVLSGIVLICDLMLHI
jgi:hypothetical protein